MVLLIYTIGLVGLRCDTTRLDSFVAYYVLVGGGIGVMGVGSLIKYCNYEYDVAQRV